MRDDFSANTREILAKRVGYRCSNSECRKVTSGPQTESKKVINVGVAAHITAASAGGPRFNPNLVAEARIAPENGIWLCQTCAKLIDSDPVRYTVESLLAWKREAEQRAARDLENAPLGASLNLCGFALDTGVCAYSEHCWDSSKPLWPEDVDPIGIVFYPGGKIGRYGRIFESRATVERFGLELEAQYNHYSFSASSPHRIYCEPLHTVNPTTESGRTLYPVFYMAVSNRGSIHAVLAAVVVTVLSVTPLVAQGKSHTLVPEYTYEVKVGPKPGSYRYSMVPSLKIEAGDAAAFRVALRPETGRVGAYAWLLSISAESLAGERVQSPVVELTM